MTQRYFITGTDTEVGKTYVTTLLLNLLAAEHYRTLGLKPLALGGDDQHPSKNSDAILLQQASSIAVDYHEINPFMLQTAAAPHVAFAVEQCYVTQQQIVSRVNQTLEDYQPDIALIEGAGGWRVPLTAQENMSDVALGLTQNILLVVGLRLGCLNHALLSAEAIRASGACCAGWVANCVEPSMPYQAENISLLTEIIKAPFLGIVGYGQTHVDAELSLQALLKS